jgi:hypothetical protein
MGSGREWTRTPFASFGYVSQGRRRSGRTAHDLMDVNPLIKKLYRGPHGSLIQQAAWTTVLLFRPSTVRFFARILVPGNSLYQNCRHMTNCHSYRWAYNLKVFGSLAFPARTYESEPRDFDERARKSVFSSKVTCI